MSKSFERKFGRNISAEHEFQFGQKGWGKAGAKGSKGGRGPARWGPLEEVPPEVRAARQVEREYQVRRQEAKAQALRQVATPLP